MSVAQSFSVETGGFARFEAEHPDDLDAPLRLLEEQMRDGVVHPVCVVKGPLFEYMRDLAEITPIEAPELPGKFYSTSLLRDPSEIVRDVAVKFMVFSVARLKPLFFSGDTRPMMQVLQSTSSARHDDKRVGNVLNWTTSGSRMTTVNPQEGRSGTPVSHMLTEGCLSAIPSYPFCKTDKDSGNDAETVELTVKTVDHEIECLVPGRQINARLHLVKSPFSITQSREVA